MKKRTPRLRHLRHLRQYFGDIGRAAGLQEVTHAMIMEWKIDVLGGVESSLRRPGPLEQLSILLVGVVGIVCDTE